MYISVFNLASLLLFVYLFCLAFFLKQPFTILVVIWCSTKVEVRYNKTLASSLKVSGTERYQFSNNYLLEWWVGFIPWSYLCGCCFEYRIYDKIVNSAWQRHDYWECETENCMPWKIDYSIVMQIKQLLDRTPWPYDSHRNALSTEISSQMES